MPWPWPGSVRVVAVFHDAAPSHQAATPVAKSRTKTFEFRGTCVKIADRSCL